MESQATSLFCAALTGNGETRDQRRKLAVLIVIGAISLLAFSLQAIAIPAVTSNHVSVTNRHAREILDKCRSLNTKPAPPPHFYSRVQSDRFQLDTPPIHIRNATIWTGHMQGLEAIKGDIFLNEGIIRSVGHIPAQLLLTHKNITTIDANGYVSSLKLMPPS